MALFVGNINFLQHVKKSNILNLLGKIEKNSSLTTFINMKKIDASDFLQKFELVIVSA